MPKTVWPPAAISAPIPPALVVCGSNEKPNVLTIAWTGILNSEPPMTYISVRESRYSYSLLQETGVFTINFPTSRLTRAVDICGVNTGRKVNKFERCGLHPAPGSAVDCPVLEESPLSLECRVVNTIPLGSHTLFMAKIEAVDVDPSLIDAAGKLHLEKAHLLGYAHGSYFELGRRVGGLGYAVRKKNNNHHQGAGR